MSSQNPQGANANDQINIERFKELKKLIGDQENRIQTLQNSSFQLANYYFVFQGVVLAAISNTTSLKCSDAWFVFMLSFLAATLNFFALLSIGSKYVRAMGMHDQTWLEYNVLAKMMSPRNPTDQPNSSDIMGRADTLDIVGRAGPSDVAGRADPLDFTGVFSPGHNVDGNTSDGVLRDRFPQNRRYASLVLCMGLFLVFTLITLSGSWVIICKHDHEHLKCSSYDNMDCLKLCDGSKCMIVCSDRYKMGN